MSPVAHLVVTYATPVVILSVALAKYSAPVWVFTAAKDFLYAQFTSQVRIGQEHDLQKQVMAWLATNRLENANALALADQRPRKKASTWSPPTDDPVYELRIAWRGTIATPRQTEVPPPEDEEEDEEDTDQLIYVPDVGCQFSYEGYRMWFEKYTETYNDPRDGRPQSSHTVIISCLTMFAGVKPLQRFLEHVKNEATVSFDAGITSYRPAALGSVAIRENDELLRWDSGIWRPRRKLDAVTLDAHIKVPLMKDIHDHLDPRTKRFYIHNVIPYRKGYLMYGPPGTGKTSFAAALAGEYGLNVYMLSLAGNNMTDRGLESLFEQLPEQCVVLMEDIDSAGIKRENMQTQPEPKEPEERPRSPSGYQRPIPRDINGYPISPPKPPRNLSNNPDALDKALVRAGRIDKKIHFGYASREVAGKMFTRVYCKSPAQLLDRERPFEGIPRLARAFAEQIPLGAITPAEIQCLLLSYRTDPIAAVAATAGFVAEAMEEKRKGTNVAGFEPDLDGFVFPADGVGQVEGAISLPTSSSVLSPGGNAGAESGKSSPAMTPGPTVTEAESAAEDEDTGEAVERFRGRGFGRGGR
ncbi:hypothetical protein B0A55_04077 [Friedmanniomyces simplex]|uniref:AAA+ ATPase domain-containing protein n=1 Tax=Friedmanniomyces simplex TaxID=329884 RepID=A0A4U0XX32_9PEZI|nr:hypothetical protein B0A55_04077 [Friedmanniomyces simplex]